MRFLVLALLLSCDRPVAPVVSREAAAPADDSPAVLEVNGLIATRADLEARAPAGSDAATTRQAHDELIDLLLAASEARNLPPYKGLAPLVAGQRLLDDQFAPERFCQGLPEGELKAWYRAHRRRYVHPERHAVAALTAGAGSPGVDLAAALEAALVEAPDAERVGSRAFEPLVARWESAAAALGASATAELWTFPGVVDHPERTPPARRHPEDTQAIVALVEGQRTPVVFDDDGARAYVKLDGRAAARRELREPEVRDDVRRRACAEHTVEARQAWLAELRKVARIVALTPAPHSAPSGSSTR